MRVFSLDGTPEAEIGYILARAYWGRGYATEAASASLRYGFEQLGLERIVAVTRPDHLVSQQVLRKLGMVFERNAYYYGAEQVCYAASRDEYRLADDPYGLRGPNEIQRAAPPLCRHSGGVPRRVRMATYRATARVAAPADRPGPSRALDR